MNKKIPVEKGKSYELVIHTLGTNGEGVGRIENFTVFVPHALPGERVRVKLNEVKKTYASAHIEELLVRSHDRVEPRCAVYGQCGGCQIGRASCRERV